MLTYDFIDSRLHSTDHGRLTGLACRLGEWQDGKSAVRVQPDGNYKLVMFPEKVSGQKTSTLFRNIAAFLLKGDCLWGGRHTRVWNQQAYIAEIESLVDWRKRAALLDCDDTYRDLKRVISCVKRLYASLEELHNHEHACSPQFTWEWRSQGEEPKRQWFRERYKWAWAHYDALRNAECPDLNGHTKLISLWKAIRSQWVEQSTPLMQARAKDYVSDWLLQQQKSFPWRRAIEHLATLSLPQMRQLREFGRACQRLYVEQHYEVPVLQHLQQVGERMHEQLQVNDALRAAFRSAFEQVLVGENSLYLALMGATPESLSEVASYEAAAALWSTEANGNDLDDRRALQLSNVFFEGFAKWKVNDPQISENLDLVMAGLREFSGVCAIFAKWRHDYANERLRMDARALEELADVIGAIPQTDTDVQLVCGDETFAVHSKVLTRIENQMPGQFHAYLHRHQERWVLPSTHVDGCDLAPLFTPVLVRCLLSFLYRGDIPPSVAKVYAPQLDRAWAYLWPRADARSWPSSLER